MPRRLGIQSRGDVPALMAGTGLGERDQIPTLYEALEVYNREYNISVIGHREP